MINIKAINGYSVSLGKQPVRIGDMVQIKGILKCYDSFRCSRGEIKKPQVVKVWRDNLSDIFWSANQIRSVIEQVYFHNLNWNQANLLSGIVLGSVDVDPSFRKKLVTTGLTHVVAASGMNVTMLAGLVAAVLLFMPINKRLVALVSIFVFSGYALMAGLAPSIVRASLMASVVVIAPLVGRKINAFLLLVQVGCLMLWVSPRLVSDYGFLLSFSSMVGQITLVSLNLKLPKPLAFFGEILLQTLFAIGFSMPIILIGFSNFSLISMVSNVLVLWTVEPLMIVGIVAGIVGNGIPELARVVLIPAGVLLNYFLWVVKSLSSENFLLQVKGFNILEATGYYFVVLCIILLVRRESDHRF